MSWGLNPSPGAAYLFGNNIEPTAQESSYDGAFARSPSRGPSSGGVSGAYLALLGITKQEKSIEGKSC